MCLSRLIFRLSLRDNVIYLSCTGYEKDVIDQMYPKLSNKIGIVFMVGVKGLNSCYKGFLPHRAPHLL